MADENLSAPRDKMSPLFADFTPTTYDEWYETTIQSLKGKPFARLIAQTYEGIDVQPIYNAADMVDLPYLETLPGQFPFVRGTKADGYLAKPWLIAQEIAYGSPQQVNEALRHDLAQGQTAVNLIPDRAARQGLDPDQVNQEDVGHRGVSLCTVTDFAVALAGVDLAKTPLFVRSGSGALPLAALLLAARRGDLLSLHGCLEADPIGELVHHGTLPLPLDKAFDELTMLVRGLSQVAPHCQAMMIHGYPYAHGGSNAVQELAFVLGTAVAYLRALQERGLDVNSAALSMQFAFSIGGDFFMEIAKLRAARMLWAQVVQAFGGEAEAQKMVLHGRTQRHNKTFTDAYVNMLRVTTEAFAAAVGGVDSLHVAPFAAEVGSPDEFSRRIARNTQVILQEEANLKHLIDPAGGSWYVEWLTDQVAQRAWALFQEVEKQGGLVAALQSGWVQAQVAETAAARVQNLAVRKDILVGTNLYANPDEQPLPRDHTDYESFYRVRCSFVSAVRNVAYGTRIAPTDLNALVLAAENGATLGQITAALRHDHAAQDRPTITAIPWRRVAEPFEQLRAAANAAAERPRIFLITMGSLRQHKARADFARDFFVVGGFEIVYPDGFDEMETAVAAALADGAQAVVICSTDETYPVLVPPLVQSLKAANPDMTILLAGYPKEQVESHKAAGIDAFIYLGADCLAVNQWLHEKVTSVSND